MEYSHTQQTELPLSPDANQLDQVVSTIGEAQRLLVISHLRPDGDAVGSVVGLVRSLRKAGKIADIGLADPPPERFSFLFEGEIVKKPGELDDSYDVTFILDSGDIGRTGFEDFLSTSSSIIINVDHHSSNTAFGEINYLDFESGATSEMIVEIIRKGHFPIDHEIAEGLYLGLLTDTRFFQNENLRPSTHQCAALLLATGLDTRPILNRLNRNRSLPELRLLGRALSRLESRFDGKMMVVVLTRDDLTACKATREHIWSCGLFGQMISIEGSMVGVAIVEDFDGKCFAEFRSSGGFNVKDVAVQLGGGGHLAASGCNRTAPIAEFGHEVLACLEKQFQAFLGKP